MQGCENMRRYKNRTVVTKYVYKINSNYKMTVVGICGKPDANVVVNFFSNDIVPEIAHLFSHGFSYSIFLDGNWRTKTRKHITATLNIKKDKQEFRKIMFLIKKSMIRMHGI